MTSNQYLYESLLNQHRQIGNQISDIKAQNFELNQQQLHEIKNLQIKQLNIFNQIQNLLQNKNPNPISNNYQVKLSEKNQKKNIDSPKKIVKTNEVKPSLLPSDFNWKTYLELNPDLLENKINSEQTCISHFLNFGNFEKRNYKLNLENLPKNFDWINYLLLNLDLVNMNSKLALQNHYCVHGKNEKRIYEFPKNVEKKLSNSDKITNPIYIFYHLYLKNDWKKIFDEQISLVKKSGLYDNCSKFFINVFGNKEIYEQLKKQYKNEKFIFSHTSKKFEFPTLELISEVSKKEDFVGLYFHSKSTSYSVKNKNKKFFNLWREFMNYHVIECWKECYNLIPKYDTVGTLYKPGSHSQEEYWKLSKNSTNSKWIGSTEHFSGNFWWFNSKYFNKLEGLSTNEKTNRFNAEWFIFKNKPKYFNLIKNPNYWSSRISELLPQNLPEVKQKKQIYNIENFSSSDFEIIKNHNQKKTEVSVIITLFNYEKYIERAINSVINNNFKSYEIIVVNDASTDSSLNKVLNFYSKKINLTIVNKKINTGLAHSRNLGIKHSVGRYFFTLDADNELKNNCLQKHYDFLKKNPDYSACYAKIDVLNSKKQKLRQLSTKKYNFNDLKNGNYIDAMAMFDTKKIVKLGLYDSDMIFYGYGWEDYELWLKLGHNNNKVGFIDETLSNYYENKNSMINETNESFKVKLTEYLNKKYNF